MWDSTLMVVKAGRVSDPYNPSGGVPTLSVNEGATIVPARHRCEVQPVELVEDDAAGTRVHTRTSWRVITQPGHYIDGLRASDGVMVDGIDGVLEVVGEVGQWPHPTHGHSEFTVRRWQG
ncbi:hypothetical protein CCICO_04405 [Corynebacterium ciconiae DSM 44920]|uniref:hypothetical protein n=1 Tax=Corynebacterium ciconiae TaxID=227319 RepID=UPI0026475759|nr:hypothetical protein [Corynebacterium ciconiae]WKD60918.1 hypothetical protein CCICO_04405 [Corynebacterium ciconiae DSM 44920]